MMVKTLVMIMNIRSKVISMVSSAIRFVKKSISMNTWLDII